MENVETEEFISREAALMKLMQDGCSAKNLQSISDMPAADVAEVVRCKGCEHYDMGVCLKIYSDGSVHPAAWQSRKPEDFCSYGKPKEKSDGQ